MKIMNNNEKLAKVAVHKSLLKEYSNSSNERIVYMDNGTEFQIQIFNPYSYVIGVSLSFNNNLKESNLLVLRPGERVWLDRYLDNESRFLFSTYEVGNSQAVKEAIKDNGNLCIKFYKEQEKRNWNNNIFINNAINAEPYNHIDVYYKDLPKSYCGAKLEDRSLGFAGDSINCYNSTIDLCSAEINGAASVNTALSASAASAATSCTYDAASTTYTSASIDTYKPKSLSKTRSKSIETGRIEEGSHSNQKFTNVYKDFEYWPFKTEYIKILPTSQKQINSNDLKKLYCHECGRKINQKYKFCPYCGAVQ